MSTLPCTLAGSCLCGKISFHCEDDFTAFHLCHCTQCRKATGSAHAANLFTRPDNIVWESGAGLVKRHDVPGRTITNAFCTECGGGVPYVSLTGKALVVPAGCLDDPPSLQPQDHIFWAERASWYEGLAATRTFPGFPE